MFKFLITYYPLIIPFLLYLPLIFIGYGTWPDIYLVLDAGKNFLETGIWTPSRNPGYFVHELSTMILNYLGGNILTNLGTVIMALIVIYSFISLCKKFEVPNYKLLALIMAVNPIFWVNATSTIDHIWALGFILAGFLFITKNKYYIGGTLLALSIGARLSSFIAVMAIFLFAWFKNKNDRKSIFFSILLCGFISLSFYIPSFINANYTLNFIGLATGDPELWTLLLRMGRFFYKNIYLWGLPAFLMLMPIIYLLLKNRKEFIEEKWRAISLLSLVIIIGYEALYFKYPLKIAYLLPLLPFALIILGIGLKNKRNLLILFGLLVFSYNFINFNTAQPDIPGQAQKAYFKFATEKGYLIKDIEDRLALYKNKCDSIECSNQIYQNLR